MEKKHFAQGSNVKNDIDLKKKANESWLFP
jgi:hypothetical protein